MFWYLLSAAMQHVMLCAFMLKIRSSWHILFSRLGCNVDCRQCGALWLWVGTEDWDSKMIDLWTQRKSKFTIGMLLFWRKWFRKKRANWIIWIVSLNFNKVHTARKRCRTLMRCKEASCRWCSSVKSLRSSTWHMISWARANSRWVWRIGAKRAWRSGCTGSSAIVRRHWRDIGKEKLTWYKIGENDDASLDASWKCWHHLVQ